jgi:CubicO group peptidase (beta-lactamase class C family)
MFNNIKWLVFIVLFVTTESRAESLPKNNPGGPAISYSESHEILESARPNDATISMYEDRKSNFIKRQKRRGNVYAIQPIGNKVDFVINTNPISLTLEKELASGYILSYIFYEKGIIKYDGKAVNGRFTSDISDKTVFFTHSTGKSIISYLVGHAICDGYIGSLDEPVKWPMMSKTLYNQQPLRNLLNMQAGDRHIVNDRSSHVMGSKVHHRATGLDAIARSLENTRSGPNQVFYNNFLTDVIANYLAYKVGDDFEELLKKVFQDKIKIENEVAFELRERVSQEGDFYRVKPHDRVSYSFYMTRLDFLRVAEAMMKDYQNKTCVGEYLKQSQLQASNWPKYRPYSDNSSLWIDSYAKKYGSQFYFDFHGMSNRNIMATQGLNGQNMMIDLDNSRIVITNSSATAWSQKVFILDVIESGMIPK